jgi:hypothetical protein
MAQRQICGLDVHRDVLVLLWVPRPKNFSLGRRVDEQKLSVEDPFRAFQQIVLRVRLNIAKA